MVTNKSNIETGQHFPPHRNFKTLTIPELLTAREAWHVPLSNMHSVIATAIGFYRFRKEDKNALGSRIQVTEARTLDNSEVRAESYPCILVLVKEWHALKELQEDKLGESMQHIIPQLLYTSTGLVVPTCVIKVDIDDTIDQGISITELSYPDNLLGGGCPILTEVQGDLHFGTVGCVVTDGERLYALTARHVAGIPGQEVYSVARGNEENIGKTSYQQVQKIRFSELYGAWPASEARSNIDAGLVEINDASYWTSQIYKLGDLTTSADLNTSNITLELIGKRVKAYGARSGIIKGKIHGLFPRYKSVAGIDYVADLLIGPYSNKGKEFCIHPGDSGALWVSDGPDADKKKLNPVALNWGSLNLIGESKPTGFALATFMSNICSSLNTDVVCGKNTEGFGPVWGKANHFSIAEILCQVLSQVDDSLSKFILNGNNNAERTNGIIKELAYVPDEWKRKFGRAKEGPNHYANIDLESNGNKLSAIKLDPKSWLDFYLSLDGNNRGALPFRIGRVYKEMKSYLQNHQYTEFFCTAGILVHYCADACNPAHVTRWGLGNPEWTQSQSSYFHKIWDNAGYDSNKIINELLQLLPKVLNFKGGSEEIESAALKLMVDTQESISLKRFTDGLPYDEGRILARDFVKSKGCRTKLDQCVIDGCTLWWRIVKSTWDGLSNKEAKRAKWDTSIDMIDIYREAAFLPSIKLEAMVG
jgi:hypothetical protein